MSKEEQEKVHLERYNEYIKLRKEVDDMEDTYCDSFKAHKLYKEKRSTLRGMYDKLQDIYKKKIMDERYNKMLLYDIEQLNEIIDFDTLKVKHMELLKQYYDNRKAIARHQDEEMKALKFKTFIMKERHTLQEENDILRNKEKKWLKLNNAEYLTKKEIIRLIRDLNEDE